MTTDIEAKAKPGRPKGKNAYGEATVPLRIPKSKVTCQSALKSIHLTASNNVQQVSKVIPFLAPFYAA